MLGLARNMMIVLVGILVCHLKWIYWIVWQD